MDQASLPRKPLKEFLSAWNVDGTPNRTGTIKRAARTSLLFDTHSETLDLMAIALGKPQIILGMPWLRKWNPQIDWTTHTLKLQDPSDEVDASLREYLPWKKDESISKITISTRLAQKTVPTEQPIPDWCKDFADVFSERLHSKLPPHRPYDHAINLKPTFIPKIAKV
jgi:hypothetical protein